MTVSLAKWRLTSSSLSPSPGAAFTFHGDCGFYGNFGISDDNTINFGWTSPDHQVHTLRFITSDGKSTQIDGFAWEGWKVSASELRYLAKNFVELPAAQKKETIEFLNAMDDHDDVHRVYAAIR